MTFTFNTDPFDDIARVRFAIGDTDIGAPIFTDEVISGVITEAGSWQKTTVALVKNIITQLLMPNFTADWLKVDTSAAIKGYERLLERLKNEYAVESVTVTTTAMIRSDSELSTDTSEYS